MLLPSIRWSFGERHSVVAESLAAVAASSLSEALEVEAANKKNVESDVDLLFPAFRIYLEAQILLQQELVS